MGVITKDYERVILKLIALENAVYTAGQYDASVLKSMVKLLNYNPLTAPKIDWKILAFQNLDEPDQKALLENDLITTNNNCSLKFYQLWDAIECIMGLELYQPNKKAPINFAKKYIQYKKIVNLNPIDAMKKLNYNGNESPSILLETYSSFKKNLKNRKNWTY